MFHLIWYILVGLIAGVIAKSVMHAHMTFFGRSCSASSDQSSAAP